MKRLLGEYDLSRVRTVMWGVHNEDEAVKAFVKSTGLQVTATGVWLDPSGVLGASPDGLIGNDSVLAVKCPYTQRNATITQALKSSNFCLERVDDVRVTLKENYNYWHQVQGQLFFNWKDVLLFRCLDH